MKGCLTPRVCPREGGGGGATERNGPESYRDYVPPQDVTGEVFGLNDAVVLTPAIAGAASPAVFAGAGAPADLAGHCRNKIPGRCRCRLLPRRIP